MNWENRIFCGLAALLCCRALPAAAGEVAAVLSSDSGHYAEAYASFKAGPHGGAEKFDASAQGFILPAEVKYVAAFGVKAAALRYPPGTRLVYALAPVEGRAHSHEISMAPRPADALAAYKKLQPGLKRLAVFWTAYPGDDYIEELRAAGVGAGMEIISARLNSPDSLPERLRKLMGKMDAFWLMPDPALITQSSVMVLSAFSCANSVPFYAPTYALALGGGTASFAPDFAAAGSEAGRALAVLGSGGQLPRVIYPE
ncbi:MAG TPA: hypothetical protein DCW72_08175, partial [Elusimicrobia bacterium]|nr:hypothetical protein [Elusimicrobiota bacterium]